MKTYTLIIDAQSMQTDAYNRGMGRYTESLLSTLLDNYANRFDRLLLLHTSRLDAANVSTMTKKLSKKVAVELVELDLYINTFNALNIDDIFSNNQYKINRYAEKALEEYKNIIWFIPSLSQDTSITTIPQVTGIPTIVLWHDLIQLLFQDSYLKDPSSPYVRSYLKRLLSLYDADMIVTNSETTKNDLMQYLFLPEEKLRPIFGGPGLSIQPTKRANQYTEKTILCVTSPEISKNMIGAVKAFAHFNTLRDNAYTLVIPSTFNEADRLQCLQYSSSIEFTGHISEEQLSSLYEHCEALLYPSKYDGLGMPIIEAAFASKPIVVSDIAVFNEFDPRGEYLYTCKHEDTSSIVTALLEATATRDLKRISKQKKYISHNYNWLRTAELFMQQIDSFPKKRERKVNNKKIAVVGPHPSSFSSIGKFISEQFYELKSNVQQLDYYYDSGPSDRTHGFRRVSPLQEYPYLVPLRNLTIDKARSYDEIIYHIGNSDHHMFTYLLAHAAPGTVVLHDTNLAGSGMISQMRSYGLLSAERADYEALLEEKFLKEEVRLISSLVSTQKKIIVHSEEALQLVKRYKLIDSVKIVRANHPMNTLGNYAKSKHDGHTLRIAIAGILSGVKGLDILDNLLRSTAGTGARFDVFGYNFFADQRVLQKLQSEHTHLRVLSNLTDYEFQYSLSQQDILFNYRSEYRGEASRATLEALRLGVIPMLRRIGWYDELPDNICFKADSQEDAISQIRDLASDIPKTHTILQSKAVGIDPLLSKSFSASKYIKGILQ